MPQKLLFPKPFSSYEELINTLEARGMHIEDRERAIRKISQVGYYRLSGFWYPCRKIKFDENRKAVKIPKTNTPERSDDFLEGVTFNSIFQLYIFDKRLRQLILDAIERIEIFIRSVVAHELGYHDPLAYKKQQYFSPKAREDYYRKGQIRNQFHEWTQKHNNLISRSREDCIVWHKLKDKQIPIWVAVESWDFGTLSKFYEYLNASYQNRICNRIGPIPPKTLKNWLHELNILRNRCAHHTRIWNQRTQNKLTFLNLDDFNRINLNQEASTRMYGLISILWYLVKNIGPSSKWIYEIADIMKLVPNIPNISLKTMGIDEAEFPLHLFVNK